MKRKILIFALALGAVLGFGSGFYSLARHHHGGGCHGRDRAAQHHWEGRHRGWGHDRDREDEGAAHRARIERLERHVADIEAALGGRPAVHP